MNGFGQPDSAYPDYLRYFCSGYIQITYVEQLFSIQTIHRPAGQMCHEGWYGWRIVGSVGAG